MEPLRLALSFLLFQSGKDINTQEQLCVSAVHMHTHTHTQIYDQVIHPDSVFIPGEHFK